MVFMLDTSERQRYARAVRKKGKAHSMYKAAKNYIALYENILVEAAIEG